MKPCLRVFTLIPVLFSVFSSLCFGQLAWPKIEQQAKPWTRWWWQGNDVDTANLTHLLQAYHQAGLGGVEITPIYGVAGREDHFIDYLSEEWVAMLKHTLQEGKRLDMGVDMATGSGWPFGGPWVSEEDASKYMTYRTFHLKERQSLEEKITCTQEPVLRALGYQVYRQGEQDVTSDFREVTLQNLKEPIASNPHLQDMAIDQVRFSKPLSLIKLMAYEKEGKVLDLTQKVDQKGMLDWVAPKGFWTLYALFQGNHGKMVERAAPGGEGVVIDHFSQQALTHYLQKFETTLDQKSIEGLRAYFNDSYEVDDAHGQANWTPEIFQAFEQQHGYKLQNYLPALLGESDDKEKSQRVLIDYRETISTLLLEHFTKLWKKWANDQGKMIRNQSHGSPANILDLYAATDIPETEGHEILRFKFASSAAHVTGKPLVSSESATWLGEHFTSSLGDVKHAVDLLLLGGVNHAFYHGTAYSPQDAVWPGWLFYATTHLNPSNPQWQHFDALNQYIARVQSFLQKGVPDHDVLLYYPVYDYFADRGNELLRHFNRVLPDDTTTFIKAATMMQESGYTFDYISDRQLQNVVSQGKTLHTGKIPYKTLVLPSSKYLPLKTFRKILALAESGATVVVYRTLPDGPPGLQINPDEQNIMDSLKSSLDFQDVNSGIRAAQVGEGRLLVGDDLGELLAQAQIHRESMTDERLQFVRRKQEGSVHYFIANEEEKAYQGWVSLACKAQSVALFDPVSGRVGLLPVRSSKNQGTQVFLSLNANSSVILQAWGEKVSGDSLMIYQQASGKISINSEWTVSFVSGGPTLPKQSTVKKLSSWTGWNIEGVQAFSGVARYTTTFKRPEKEADAFRLDLGKVANSARIMLNGDTLGTFLGPQYAVEIPEDQIQESNTLVIEVANLMGNRIASLDKQNYGYQRFYNINFPARKEENADEHGLFTAKKWKPQPSGLLSTVQLIPLKKQNLLSSE